MNSWWEWDLSRQTCFQRSITTNCFMAMIISFPVRAQRHGTHRGLYDRPCPTGIGPTPTQTPTRKTITAQLQRGIGYGELVKRV
jgi:hypothetical protein